MAGFSLLLIAGNVESYPLFGQKLDTVYLNPMENYKVTPVIIAAEVGQIQDFVCPGNQEFALYLVTRQAFKYCDVSEQQLLHWCVTYKFSKVLYYCLDILVLTYILILIPRFELFFYEKEKKGMISIN